MVAKIFAKYGPMKGNSFELEEEMSVGRAKSNHIVLSHKLVSNQHARIYRDFEKDCYMVEDLDSLNGTLLDGTTVEKPERLGHLHILNFGGSADFFFVDGGRAPRDLLVTLTASKPQPVLPASKAKKSDVDKKSTFFGKGFIPTPEILGSSPKAPGPEPELPGIEEKNSTMYGEKPVVVPNALMAKLRQPNGVGAKKDKHFCLTITNLKTGPLTCNLEEGENLLGRGEGVAVRVVHSEISRHHAMIEVRDNRVFIRDLGSTNHTYVGGKITDGEVEIKAGTKVAFGKIKGKLDTRKT